MGKGQLTKKDFAKIYEAYYGKIFSFISKRVSGKEIAEDLTGEVFEKIYIYLKDFQWQGVTVSAWIFRIARNHVIDFYRKNNKHKNNKSLDDVANFIESQAPGVETQMMADEEEAALYKAMRELSEEEQYLIYYRFFENLSNKEIADQLGQTETNIGTRLHRVRKKLAKLIKSQEYQ